MDIKLVFIILDVKVAEKLHSRSKLFLKRNARCGEAAGAVLVSGGNGIISR